MLRKPVQIAGRLAVSAALSWTLIPIAVAEGPAPNPAGTAAAPQPGEPSGKRLFTVPEDGMGDAEWLSGATRFVREVVQKRPNEDMVICIAGCLANQDRVVFAQPAEPVSPKPKDVMSDGAPSMPPAAPAPAASAPKPTVKPVAKASEPSEKPAKPAASSADPAMQPSEKSAALPAKPVAAPAAAEAGMTTDAEMDSAPAIAPAAKAATEDAASGAKFVPSMAAPAGDASPAGAEPDTRPEMMSPKTKPASGAAPEG